MTVEGLLPGWPCTAGEAAASRVRTEAGLGQSFMAGHFGGREAGKRPALLMLQGSMVSMTTAPSFHSQRWMPQGER